MLVILTRATTEAGEVPPGQMISPSEVWSTGEACPLCRGELELVSAEGALRVECGCGPAFVLA